MLLQHESDLQRIYLLQLVVTFIDLYGDRNYPALCICLISHYEFVVL